MKSIKYSILGLGLLGMMLTGCQDDYDAPELEVPKATMEANTTIAEFKTLFGDEVAVETPYKDEATQTPYILKGRVVSTDASGNIYQSLVIQDETAAIAISVRRNSIYITYPLGQEVLINATGLWIGQYNGYIQFGALGDNNGNPQITFMAYPKLVEHTELNGLPTTDFKYVRYGKEYPSDRPYCIVTSLEEISNIAGAGEQFRNMLSQLVEINNVSFVDGGKLTFSPYQDNANREIKDAAGNTLIVRCSGYSTFYNDLLPTGIGTVRGILSYFGGNWQLVMRDRSDAIFTDEGSKAKPYTTQEVIDMDNNGRTAWAQGVIVGSVKSGVDNVSSVDQIIFSAAGAELDNNVVIAPDADCRDLEKLVVVELPAGTRVRQYVNLLDNPQAFGKRLALYGAFDSWLGMHGVIESPGGYSDFELEGLDLGDITSQGSGTEDSPYTVNYILANPEPQTAVWIEGYIVGFVDGRDFATGATFSADTKGADYGGNNIVLSASATATDPASAVPVSLSGDFRKEYRLDRNPGMLGKKVKIQGNISEDIFGTVGINGISIMQTVE